MVALVERSTGICSTEFKEAKSIFESIDVIKQDMWNLFKVFQWKYAVVVVLLEWKRTLPQYWLGSSEVNDSGCIMQQDVWLFSRIFRPHLLPLKHQCPQLFIIIHITTSRGIVEEKPRSKPPWQLTIEVRAFCVELTKSYPSSTWAGLAWTYVRLNPPQRTVVGNLVHK